MLEIIPAIDLRGGRCVRLFQGDYARETVFGDDPVAMARHWTGLGARRLHIVDLDGARAGAPVQLPLVREIGAAAGVPVQLGGGLRRLADVEAALEAGVERVVLGTAAIGGPNDEQAAAFRLAARAAYGERVVVGLDARDGMLAVRGWTEATARDAFTFAQELQLEGFTRIVYTDISRDGTLTGPNLEHLQRLAAILGLAVIASGGIGRLEDLDAVARVGAEAAIVGQALYTGAIDLAAALERHAAGIGG